jgi:hypothetical protein
MADLPGLLLWMWRSDTGPLVEGIPSWSWALRKGKTKFWLTEGLHAMYWETLCSHIAFEELCKLAVSSPVRTVWSSSDLGIYREPMVESDEHKDQWVNFVFTMRGLYNGTIYSILGQNREMVGVAVFDRDVVLEGLIHCLFMVRESTSANDHALNTFPEEVGRTLVKPQNEYTYYVLLLLPLPHQPSSFVRVGMGVIVDDNWIRGAAERLVWLN